MPYTTLVSGTVITASWANASVRDQAVTPFATAAARSSAITSPVTGMLSYRTDGGLFEGYDGAGWVAAGRFCPAARKTADETVNTSAALQNDDHLAVAVAANAVYMMASHVQYNSGITPDLKIGWTFPAGLTMVWGHTGIDTAGTFVSVGNLIQTTVQPIGGWGSDAQLHLYGTVTVGGTAGTLQMQWAQNTSTASDTKLLAGSWLMLTRIA